VRSKEGLSISELCSKEGIAPALCIDGVNLHNGRKGFFGSRYIVKIVNE